MFSSRQISHYSNPPQEFMDKYINPGEEFQGGNQRAMQMASRYANAGQPMPVVGVSRVTSGDNEISSARSESFKNATPSGSPQELDDYTQYLLKTPTRNLQFHDQINAINQRLGKQPQSGNKGFDRFFNLQRQAAADQGNQFVPADESDMRVVEHLRRDGWRQVRPIDTQNGDPDAMPPMRQSSRYANPMELPMTEEDFLFQPGQAPPNFAPASMPAGNNGVGEVPNFSGGWIDELQPRTAQMDMREGVPDAPIAQNQPPAQMPPPSNPPYDDALRQLMMGRMTGHEEMANQNLNYWNEDLTRRSRRDAGDDFWSNVGAPIAGGMGSMMGQDTNGLNQMAAGWQGQRQARTGERMNLVNMLSGRQNSAQNYMMATDPNVIKNQMGLINALANRSRADAYGQGVNNNYALGKEKLKFTQMDAETRQQSMKNLDEFHDSQIEQLAKNGLIDRDLANSTIAYRQAQATHMQNQDEQNALNEKGRDYRFNKGQEGEDRRLGVHEAGLDKRLGQGLESTEAQNLAKIKAQRDNLEYEQDQINWRTAAGLDAKGKPKTSEDFRKLINIPKADRAIYLAAMRKWNSLSPQEQSQNKQGYSEFVKRRFGITID